MKIWNEDKTIAINSVKVTLLQIAQEAVTGKVLVYAYLESGERHLIRSFGSLEQAREFISNISLE